MQKSFEIEQGVPEIWGFKGLEMILLRETKTGKNTTVRPAVLAPVMTLYAPRPSCAHSKT